MTITTATSYQEAGSPPLISPRGWVWILGLGALFAALHYNFIYRMGWIALGEQGKDWSHALVVPLISIYFMYQHRHQMLGTPRRVFWPGLPLLVLAITSYIWWIYPGRNDMFQGYSMILGLFGLTLFLMGPGMLRWLWFPILYLAVGVKVSPRIWDQIAWQLQLIAAHFASVVLNFIGVFIGITTDVSGATIDMWSDGKKLNPLNVAEACSGLRMLMAFIALGIAMAYLANRPLWQRLIMVGITIPTAVAVNVGRVATLGILYAKVDPELASGDFHTFIGLLMLIPAALLFMLVGWILDRIIIREDDGFDEASSVPPPWGGANTQTWDSQVVEHRGLFVGGAAMTGVALIYNLLSKLMGVELFGLSTHIGTAAACIGVVLMMIACTRRTPQVLKGMGIGASLVLLIGAVGVLAIGSLRPLGDLFPEALGRMAILGLLAAAVTGLVVVGWRLRRALDGESSPHPGPRPVSMGLCAGVLLTAVLGLNYTVDAAKFVLIKAPVPMREPLYRIDRTPTPFRAIDRDEQLTPEIVEVLGTDRYLSRWYTDDPRAQRRQDAGEALIWLHVAYYTGTPDTVPHVPERCYTAGGASGLGMSYPRIQLEGPQYFRRDGEWWAFSEAVQQDVRVPDVQVDVTRFTYQPRGTAGAAPPPPANVVYFFIANGKYLPTPDHVRFQGFDPRDRHAYYCKVEVGFPTTSDPDVALRRAELFLSKIMPDILACLPDWTDVVEGRWPTPQTPAAIERSSRDQENQ